jgi:hypothetical protein
VYRRLGRRERAVVSTGERIAVVAGPSAALETGDFSRDGVLCSYMGFGSYDESEQKEGPSDLDDEEDDAVNVHESTHDGDVSFESDMSNEELVGQLSEMKDDGDGDDED